jgi:uncharacterized protein
MRLFLLTFFFLYGGTHLYFFLKLMAAISLAPGATLCLSLFLLVMTLAPLLVRVLENEGLERAARLFAYVGYTWMGVLFLFFSVSIVLDICRLVALGAGLLSHRDVAFFAATQRPAFLISCCCGIVAAAYGYFEARNIRTERVVIVSPKIPQSVGKLTIVQISDVHLGLIVRQERLSRIIEQVKAAAPDVLVSTGDLVDGQINRMAGLAELLHEIKPRYGKFAVTGNHEFYAGLEQALAFTERAGFRMLRNEWVTVAEMITIVGVDDPAGSQINRSRVVTEKSLLSQAPPDTFILFLKHRPSIDRESLGLFDVQLSGHVHKGQIFPFNLVTQLFYPIKTGYSVYPRNSALYVSRGTGTWGPPIRFLAPPEVTVIELVSPPPER